MARVKKVKARLTLAPNGKEWVAAAEDGSGLEATGLKPKNARSKLLGLLIDRYKSEVELDDYVVLPEDLEREIKALEEDTELAEKLLARIPAMRHKIARTLHDLRFDQTTIAEKVGLTQAYIAQFIQLDPKEVAKMTAVIGRRQGKQ